MLKRNSKPLRFHGQSNRAKERAKWHRELLTEWQTKGIHSCEFQYDECMNNFGLSLAHSKKRRYILTRDDYWTVGAACQQCHNTLDLKMSHEDMENEIKRIIAERETR